MSGSTFTATLTGYRIANLYQQDTIEGVAARELGDAAQWRTLVNVNGLTWPFLTDDPTQASATVLLTTGTIKVPAAQPASASAVTDDTVFGTDLSLVGGQLQVANGDLATVSGADNLVASIARWIIVPLGQLPWHKLYGCLVGTLRGMGGTKVNNQLAASYVARAIKGDPRIDTVTTTATLAGDVITVEGKAVAVNGKVLPTGKINVPS